jgi:protein Mpv17
MKLAGLLIASTLFVASAFGVTHQQQTSLKTVRSTTSPDVTAPAFTKGAVSSPLFRDAALTRGGAVPGWAAYNEALDKKPLITKAMTSLVGWALGDFLAQVFISKAAFDMKRFITLSAFGFLYHGPSGHYFYNWLDKQIEGTSSKVVALKVLIDQTLWCPIFMSVFFTYLGLVNGDSMATIGNKIKNDLFTAVQGSWKVWPIVHAVNFKFISTKHRLVFINGVQVAFNMFLSIIGSK